ncbi:MAG: hypothetical protein M3385_08415 [Actinomycetota bacterium]|nr:hypothetical protein [Actinomycetota bacterium]
MLADTGPLYAAVDPSDGKFVEPLAIPTGVGQIYWRVVFTTTLRKILVYYVPVT